MEVLGPAMVVPIRSFTGVTRLGDRLDLGTLAPDIDRNLAGLGLAGGTPLLRELDAMDNGIAQHVL